MDRTKDSHFNYLTPLSSLFFSFNSHPIKPKQTSSAILEKQNSEGSLLIEDLRQDGLLHPQPKSDFSNNKKNMKRNNTRRKKQTQPPTVVVTGEDPTEDFRTIVELNMMGI